MSINLWKIYFFENYFRAVYAYSKNITLNLWWKSCCTKKNLSNNLSTKSYCLKKKTDNKIYLKEYMATNIWHNVQYLTNIWQKSTTETNIKSYWEANPFSKVKLEAFSYKKEAFGGRKERGRWGWKYYGQRGRDRVGCWLLSNISKIVIKIIIVIAISTSFCTLSLPAINKSIVYANVSYVVSK